MWWVLMHATYRSISGQEATLTKEGTDGGVGRGPLLIDGVALQKDGHLDLARVGGVVLAWPAPACAQTAHAMPVSAGGSAGKGVDGIVGMDTSEVRWCCDQQRMQDCSSHTNLQRCGYS